MDSTDHHAKELLALLESPGLLEVSVVGLGYVGLPLAIALGAKHSTIGFDIDPARVDALARGVDHTRQCDPGEIESARFLRFSAEPKELGACHVHIVTVPTPIDAAKRPDLAPLRAACRTLGPLLARGSIIVFESTVFPGCTEEVCVPLLEDGSGLRFNVDFFVGYSPERINPGDRAHGLVNVRKVTSGSTPAVAAFVDALYAGIIPAGTHRAPSIKVAEAAKVIENTQRDLNIALVNDLAILFRRMGIDTQDVLDAAATKWNFMPFRPGLVGGHCIGVDPYYLTYKAQALGHHPDVILAGRRTNDGMAHYVAEEIVHLMASRGIGAVGARALVMGFSFKENCPDVRNTQVAVLVARLREFGVRVDVHDPVVDATAVAREYGIDLVGAPTERAYQAVVLAVPHTEFLAVGAARIRGFGADPCIVYDVKGALPREAVDGRL